ncbi:MAG: MFS transporter [Terriglobia bacterium]
MASQRTGTGIRLVVLLWFALALNYVDRQMVYSIFPALKAELHFTDIQLALVGSLFTWVYALGMPVAGYLADRVRRERMIVASMVLWSIATLGCGLSQSVAGFLVWRGAMGITESLYYPAPSVFWQWPTRELPVRRPWGFINLLS